MRRYNPDKPKPPSPPVRRLPAGICDACGRMSWTLHEADIPCFWCKRGQFRHRGNFVIWWCPACRGDRPFCDACFNTGVVGTPLEETLPVP